MTYVVDVSAWILTYTGRKFFPLSPNPDDIDIRDIAHALSLVCRFTGHVKQFYCVAQHCVLASHIVPREHAFATLLHDASEAYICDLARPVKSQPVMEPYRLAERRLEDAIDVKFGIDSHTSEVKEADLRMLFTERRDLLPLGHWVLNPNEAEQCLPDPIVPWTSRRAEREFLHRFRILSRRRDKKIDAPAHSEG